MIEIYFRTTRKGKVELTLNEIINRDTIYNTTFNFNRNRATFSAKVNGKGFKKFAKQNELFKIEWERRNDIALSKRVSFADIVEVLTKFHLEQKSNFFKIV